MDDEGTRDENTVSILLSLPLELQLAILAQAPCHPRDVPRLQMVCRGWYHLLNDDLFWREMSIKLFGIAPLVQHTLSSWKEYFTARAINEAFLIYPDQQV